MIERRLVELHLSSRSLEPLSKLQHALPRPPSLLSRTDNRLALGQIIHHDDLERALSSSRQPLDDLGNLCSLCESLAVVANRLDSDDSPELFAKLLEPLENSSGAEIGCGRRPGCSDSGRGEEENDGCG